MPRLPRSLDALLQRAGFRAAAAAPLSEAGPEWLSISQFDAFLDADGCSADFWIRRDAREALAFFAARGFDGHPPGWFNTYGEPVDFEPDLFRAASC
jgi:hypothetical protein